MLYTNITTVYPISSSLEEILESVTEPPTQDSPSYTADYNVDYTDSDVDVDSDYSTSSVLVPVDIDASSVIPGNDYVAVVGAGDIIKEAEPRLDIVHEDDDEDYDYNAADAPPLEYSEFVINQEARQVCNSEFK